ncbi:DUF2637 domain-containing protein [Micromonospora sp. NPDC023644]|uniref:DUF2637 domain-containing protein n=1 Tax=Micromonospora sp. NPDC023644 TaxID=3154321 RepID=UPI0033DEE440
MTAPTINGTRYPQPIDELVPRALAWAEQERKIPSRNALMRQYRIGAPKADAVRAEVVRLLAGTDLAEKPDATPAPRDLTGLSDADMLRTAVDIADERGEVPTAAEYVAMFGVRPDLAHLMTVLVPLARQRRDAGLPVDIYNEPADGANPVPLDYAEPIGPDPAPPAPAETTERAETLRAAMTARGALLPPAGTSWTDPGVPESVPVAEPAPTPAPAAPVAEAAEQVTVVGHPGPNITTAPAATRSAGRGWAYVGVILGGVVSIAANVAHTYLPKPPEGAPAGWTPAPDWSPSPLAVAFSVFWPVALFVAVEILTRIPWGEGLRWFMARIVGVLPVALVAAVVSYRHLAGLLEHFGEDPLTVAIGPLAIDGLMVMASAALLATNRHRNRT